MLCCCPTSSLGGIALQSQSELVSSSRPRTFETRKRDSTSAATEHAAIIIVDEHPASYGGFSDVYAGTFHEYVQGEGRVKNEHLEREALVWSLLDHVLIAKFYGVTSFGPQARPALVSCWYRKGVATRYLEDKTFEVKLGIVRDIASAIAYLHSLNIIHGDIKGTNVLISDDGRGLVTDFGLSRVIGLQTGYTTSSMPGSTRWQAPELLTAASAPANRSKEADVWAFGCTVFELLSGQLPYACLKNNLTLISTITSGRTPMHVSKVGMPEFIRTILGRCWAMSPSDRALVGEVVVLLGD